jgi:hypothetical protein
LIVEALTMPSTPFGRWTWHLHHPAFAALVVVVLLATSPQPRMRPLVPPPGKMGGDPGWGGTFMSAERTLVRNGDHFDVADPNQTSWDKMTKIITQRPQDVLLARCESTVARRGIWYPTHISGDRRIVLEALPSAPPVIGGNPASRPRWPFTPQELATARADFAAYLASVDAEFAAGVKTADEHVYRFLPLGVLYNGVWLAGLGLLVFSLIGMRRYVRAWKAEVRLKRGNCGLCLYDLAGTEPSNGWLICPECGSWWSAASDGSRHVPDDESLRRSGAESQD